MRAVKQSNLQSHLRSLQTSDQPLFALELNELTTITFDFNFGDGAKDLLLGLQFNYDSDDDLTNS